MLTTNSTFHKYNKKSFIEQNASRYVYSVKLVNQPVLGLPSGQVQEQGIQEPKPVQLNFTKGKKIKREAREVVDKPIQKKKV